MGSYVVSLTHEIINKPIWVSKTLYVICYINFHKKIIIYSFLKRFRTLERITWFRFVSIELLTFLLFRKNSELLRNIEVVQDVDTEITYRNNKITKSYQYTHSISFFTNWKSHKIYYHIYETGLFYSFFLSSKRSRIISWVPRLLLLSCFFNTVYL